MPKSAINLEIGKKKIQENKRNKILASIPFKATPFYYNSLLTVEHFDLKIHYLPVRKIPPFAVSSSVFSSLPVFYLSSMHVLYFIIFNNFVVTY